MKSPSTSFNDDKVKLPKSPVMSTAPLTVSKESRSISSNKELLKMWNSPSISVRFDKSKVSKLSLAKICKDAPTLVKESKAIASNEL